MRAICRSVNQWLRVSPNQEPAFDCDADCDVTPFENADLSRAILIEGDEAIDRKSLCRWILVVICGGRSIFRITTTSQRVVIVA
jgi:hypothetical protein